MQRAPQSLWDLLEPVVSGLGYDLVEIEQDNHPQHAILRVYIDRGEEGVTIDDCGKVSAQIGAVLDVEDPVSGEYNLELSSPGLDRPLRVARDFLRFVGSQVRIKLDLPVNGRKKFKGLLSHFEADTITVVVDGEAYELPLSAVRQARIVPEF